jgi:hypothetical protein
MRFDEKLRRDPINYDPGQVVEFHRLAKGGVQERTTYSTSRWQR